MAKLILAIIAKTYLSEHRQRFFVRPHHFRVTVHILTWSRKVHFARSWLGRHFIQTWFHQRWCPENFTPLAQWRTTTNAHSILPYPMGGQIFKVIFLQSWLKIHIICKRLREESVFLFCKFPQEHLRNQEKLRKTELTLTYPEFFLLLSYLTNLLRECWESFLESFLQGIWIFNPNCKKITLKIWPPIG